MFIRRGGKAKGYRAEIHSHFAGVKASNSNGMVLRSAQAWGLPVLNEMSI
jgi:hypothetical protein